MTLRVAQVVRVYGAAAVELTDGRDGPFTMSDVDLVISEVRCGYRITEYIPGLDWTVSWGWRPTLAAAVRRLHRRLGELVERGYVLKDEEAKLR